MFQTLVIQPIFNVLAAIYALMPGHNFGLAIILFTVIVRLCMWPLVKRQLKQAKVTRQLQPELKRIKKEAAGDRQKESMLMMELYKERGVNPLGSLPVLIVQMIVLFGLYLGLIKVIHDPHQIYKFAYEPIQHLPWMKHLASNIHYFDNSLFNLIDLSRPAIGKKGFYLPAFLLVLGSAGIQYVTSRQLMPTSQDGRKLRQILKEAGEGKSADQSEVNAAMSRNMSFFIPGMVLLFTIQLAAALSLYWLTGGVVAYFQQRRALADEEEVLEAAADKPLTGERGSKITLNGIPEAEIVSVTPAPKKTAKKPKTTTKAKKRRR